MSMQDDKKRNISLIIGLAIPVAMVLFIAVAISGPRWFNTVEPAAVNFLYSTGQHNPYAVYIVVDGRLTLQEQTVPEGGVPATQFETHFFVHDVASNKSREIKENEAFELHLDSTIRSPDGFTIETGRRGGWFIFGYGRNYNDRYLVKDRFSEKLSLETNTGSYSYYWNFQFRGWIVSDG